MLWSTVPAIIVLMVLWTGTKFDLGKYKKDEFYNVFIPQDAWANFKIFLIVLFFISLPFWLISTYAKYRNKKHKRLYPHSRQYGWSTNFDDDIWTFTQFMALVVLIIILIIVTIFS